MVNLLESMHKCCIPSGVPSESPSAYEKSLVHRIFGGRLRSQVYCVKCSITSVWIMQMEAKIHHWLALHVHTAGEMCTVLTLFQQI
jgi:hypothetical protein